MYFFSFEFQALSNHMVVLGLAAAPLLNLILMGLSGASTISILSSSNYQDQFEPIIVTVCSPLGIVTSKSHGPIQSYCVLPTFGVESHLILSSVWWIIWSYLLPFSGASRVATHPPSNQPCTLKYHLVLAFSLMFMSNL